MKTNCVILSVICCASMVLCYAKDDLKTLDAELKKLATPVITIKAKTGILTENTKTEAYKKATKDLNDFLKTKFVKFIGSDNRERQDYAQAIVEDFDTLLRGIPSVFNKLALAAAKGEVSSAKTSLSSGAAKDVDLRKTERLVPTRLIKVVDLAAISWGSEIAGTGKQVSTDEFIANSLQYLDKVRQDVKNISTFAKNGKNKCFGQGCKDRFDFLTTANNLLDALVKKIDAGIAELRKAESKGLQKASGGFYYAS